MIGRILGRNRVTQVQQDAKKYFTGSSYQEGDLTEKQLDRISNERKVRKSKLEIFSPEWEKRRTDEIANNTDFLNAKRIELSDLLAVRVIHHKNYNLSGNRMYAAPDRATIHFTLNGWPGKVPGGGGRKRKVASWDYGDSVLLSPLKDLIVKNRRNFYGGTEEDVFFVGYANLPENALILNREKGETHKEFRKRVIDKIEEMGFKPLFNFKDHPKGRSITLGFNKLLIEKGYGTDLHSNTLFGEVEAHLQNFVRRGGYDSPDRMGPMPDEQKSLIREKYIREVGEKKGLNPSRFLRKRKNITPDDLEEFYQYALKENQNIPKYEEWLKEELGDRTYLGSEIGKRIKLNSRFFRDIYSKSFRNKVNSIRENDRGYYDSKIWMIDAERRYKAWKDKVKSEYKNNSEDFPKRKEDGSLEFKEDKDYSKFKDLELEGKNIREDLERKREGVRGIYTLSDYRIIRQYLSDFSPAMESWKKYWDENFKIRTD